MEELTKDRFGNPNEVLDIRGSRMYWHPEYALQPISLALDEEVEAAYGKEALAIWMKLTIDEKLEMERLLEKAEEMSGTQEAIDDVMSRVQDWITNPRSDEDEEAED